MDGAEKTDGRTTKAEKTSGRTTKAEKTPGRTTVGKAAKMDGAEKKDGPTTTKGNGLTISSPRMTTTAHSHSGDSRTVPYMFKEVFVSDVSYALRQPVAVLGK